jgi:hypothetical protein
MKLLRFKQALNPELSQGFRLSGTCTVPTNSIQRMTGKEKISVCILLQSSSWQAAGQ